MLLNTAIPEVCRYSKDQGFEALSHKMNILFSLNEKGSSSQNYLTRQSFNTAWLTLWKMVTCMFEVNIFI